MKDYAAEFQRQIAAINADSKNINIINAGVMNHGKSSLLNSLLDAETFQVQDIRTTIENNSANWFDNVYLIDTPGLAAEGADDEAAYAGYRRANFIMFVYNITVGELHKKELNALNKIRALFNNDKFFLEHFCLILTFKDADRDGSTIEPIKAKALADIKSNCGLKGFKTFVVSNTRYQKGRAENKSALVEKSGIPELRDFLKSNLQTWNNENAYFRAMRIDSAKSELVAQLQQERGKVQSRISSATDQIKQRQQSFLSRLEAALQQRSTERKAAADFDQSQKYTLESMQREYERLCDAEERAMERYDNSFN